MQNFDYKGNAMGIRAKLD